MTKYNTLNLKFSNSQFNKPGGVICDRTIFGSILSNLAKKGTDIARDLREDFLDKQIYKYDKEYITEEGSGITLTKNEIKDIVKITKSLEYRRILLEGTTRKISTQEGGFLNFLRPLMTAGLILMKNALTPLAKSVLSPFLLTAEMAATDTAIKKNFYGSGTIALIISNEEMEDIMKRVEESGLIIKSICETIKNEVKGQKSWFLQMLLGTLAVIAAGNILTGRKVISAVEGTNRAGQRFNVSSSFN